MIAGKQFGISDQVFQSDIFHMNQAPKRGTRQLLQSYSDLPWVNAVISRISMTIASNPLQLFVLRDSRGRPVRDTILQHGPCELRHKRFQQLLASGDLQEITSHPLLTLLRKPNIWHNGTEFIGVTQAHLDLKGETFWLIERNGAGLPAELWPIPPHWVSRIPTLARPSFTINFGGLHQEVPVGEMVWLRHLDPAQPYGRGVGQGDALGDELDIDEFASKFTKSWFYNDAVPPLLIGIENAGRDELERAKEKWREEHSGFFRKFIPHFYRGKINVQQLSNSFKDQQLNELRKTQRETIRQVYGVPPEVLGIIENSNRATVTAASFIFAKYVLVPRLDFLRETVQNQLVDDFDNRLIVGFPNPIPEDRMAQDRIMMRIPAAFEVNEIRSRGGEAPNDDLEGVHLLPGNLVPTSLASGHEEETPPNGTAAAAASARKVITPGDVEAIAAGLSPNFLAESARPVYSLLIEDWAGRTLSDLGSSISFDLANPVVEAFLEDLAGQRIVEINETMRGLIRSALAEGIREGEGARAIAARVREVFAQASRTRALTIARTEVNRAANFATEESFVQSGVVAQKRWLATLDDVTRDDHVDFNGALANVGEAFDLAGFSPMYPGDFGVPEQDINCRCTILPVVDEVELSASQLTQRWKAFDRALLPWERRVADAFRSGWEAQLAETIRRINEVDR